ncbi:MAG: hypothetical protein ACLFRY_14310 [Spirochaetia bacterium]
MTPLLPFSKTDSKKIELALILLLLTAGAAHPQTLHVSVEHVPAESAVSLDCLVVEAPEEELWESVDGGFQVEVVYTLRLYRKSAGLFRFLGDKIVEDAEPTRTGEYDPFSGLYLIHDTYSGGTIRSDNRNSFLSKLLRVDDIRLEIPREEGSYYILAEAEISPIKLKPPLTILSVFSKRNRYHTDWIRIPVPDGEAFR